jgi:hypothetical protein
VLEAFILGLQGDLLLELGRVAEARDEFRAGGAGDAQRVRAGFPLAQGGDT